jgi:uncharacterized membrane protein
MRREVTVPINAVIDKVWDILVDFERWPDWTRSVSKVRRRNHNRGIGADTFVWLSQPGLPTVRWAVTTSLADRTLRWGSRTIGIWRRRHHELRDLGDGRTDVRSTCP